MRVLGVDLATEPAGTAACWLTFDGVSGRAELVEERIDDETLIRLIASSDRAAIDAPFGWPEPFYDAISQWRREGTFPDGTREPLRLRATDLYVKQRALTPYSVSADKIVLTGLADVERTPIDRVDGRAIECYPSAALYRFGFTRAELRNAKTDREVRRRLLEEIMARATWLKADEDTTEKLVRVGHCFDALIAALVAWAATLGMTDRPPPELVGLAAIEGWIHLPLREALVRHA
jgi:predicted nuclease with RNAse H fold